MKIAIVGYGSLIRGDDSAGLIAVDIIKDKIKQNDGLKKKVGFFYGYNAVDLLGEFDNFDKFIIIDCALLNKKPGEFIKAKVNELEFGDDTSFTHNTNFKELLSQAEQLQMNVPIIEFYLLQPDKMDISSDITNDVQKGMHKMINEIVLMISKN